MKITNFSEENIILAPPTELFDEAKEIAKTTVDDDKFPFMLHYDANQKEHLLSMLGMVGAIVEDDDDDGHVLSTMMNMTQLAFIKRLDCIERVKTDEGINPFLAEEVVSPEAVEAETLAETPVETVAPQTAEAMQTEQVMTLAADESVAVAAPLEITAEPVAATADDGIAVACVGGSSSSCSCPTNKDMANAQDITVETLISGCICCPGTEQWFKFTVPSSKQYTIFTTGSLDTEGELSGCCLATPIYNDDFAGRVNFRIIASLCAGYEYYIKVSAKNDATGSYTLKVTEQVLAESVTINSQRSDGIILLEEGKTYELPRGEGYSYLYNDGELDAKNTPIYHLPISVGLTPAGTNEKRVYWSASSIPTDPVDTDFTWYDNTTKYQTITANSCGAAKLYAYDWLERGKRGEIYVVVAPSVSEFVKATSFKICKEGTTTEISALSMDIGEYQKIIASISPGNATVQAVEWVSDNPNIATVTPYGRVKAIAPGIATIRAKAMDGSGVYGCCEVRCNLPSSGSDSIGVFRTFSTLGTTQEEAETGAPDLLGVQFRERQDGYYDIRFVSQINNLYYKEVGYEIYSKFDDAAPVSNVISSNVAYRSFIAAGETISADEGYYFVLGVMENIPENTVASFKIVPFAITLEEERLYGKTSSFACKNAQIYYYISNKTDDSKVISYKNALDGALEGANYRADVCVESLIRSAKQIWRISNVSEAVNGCYIRAYLDESYGFNFRTTNSNCDLRTVDDNLNDAAVRFIDQGNGYYKICLANYENYYLTMTDGYDVRWVNENNENDNQLWKLNVVDWEQYENEHKEYHLLCNGDTSKALRVGTRNVLEIDEPLPVRGERLSYWNRQKWTIKGEGAQKRLCSQLNNEYFLCNDGGGNAHVSNNASDSNSHLTIEPYGNSGKYTIKLSGSNLYLTLAYGEYVQGSKTYYAEWGKWLNFNSDDPSMQLWEFMDQPVTNHLGVDTKCQISNTTAKILKKEGMDFAIKYYATKANIEPKNYDKILTESEVTALHNAGLKIVVVYEDGGKNFSTERGISDATEALRLATLLGQQKGSAIYFGVEPEYSDQVNAIAKYFEAVQKKISADGRYKVGVYGVAKVCNNIKDTLGYAEYSWIGVSTNLSGSSSIEGDADYIAYDGQQKYNIKQSEPIIYNKVEFDSDTAIKQDFGAW